MKSVFNTRSLFFYFLLMLTLAVTCTRNPTTNNPNSNKRNQNEEESVASSDIDSNSDIDTPQSIKVAQEITTNKKDTQEKSDEKARSSAVAAATKKEKVVKKETEAKTVAKKRLKERKTGDPTENLLSTLAAFNKVPIGTLKEAFDQKENDSRIKEKLEANCRSLMPLSHFNFVIGDAAERAGTANSSERWLEFVRYLEKTYPDRKIQGSWRKGKEQKGLGKVLLLAMKKKDRALTDRLTDKIEHIPGSDIGKAVPIAIDNEDKKFIKAIVASFGRIPKKERSAIVENVVKYERADNTIDDTLLVDLTNTGYLTEKGMVDTIDWIDANPTRKDDSQIINVKNAITAFISKKKPSNSFWGIKRGAERLIYKKMPLNFSTLARELKPKTGEYAQEIYGLLNEGKEK